MIFPPLRSAFLAKVMLFIQKSPQTLAGALRSVGSWQLGYAVVLAVFREMFLPWITPVLTIADTMVFGTVPGMMVAWFGAAKANHDLSELQHRGSEGRWSSTSRSESRRFEERHSQPTHQEKRPLWLQRQVRQDPQMQSIRVPMHMFLRRWLQGFHMQPTEVNRKRNSHYQITSLASKTGPSTHDRFLPCLVSTMHERQAPIPHAIRFSRETYVGIPALSVSSETMRIIGSGAGNKTT